MFDYRYSFPVEQGRKEGKEGKSKKAKGKSKGIF
jgi:hypothetical protein